MPCPNCDGTMQNLGLDSVGRRTFWCPNCGTLKNERDGGLVEVDTPRVTERLNAGRGGAEFVAWEDEYFVRRARLPTCDLCGEPLCGEPGLVHSRCSDRENFLSQQPTGA